MPTGQIVQAKRALGELGPPDFPEPFSDRMAHRRVECAVCRLFRASAFGKSILSIQCFSDAQGDHKIQRGYLPVPTFSAHWVVDSGFRRAIEDYLKRERPAVEQEIEGLKQYSPFRKENE